MRRLREMVRRRRKLSSAARGRLLDWLLDCLLRIARLASDLVPPRVRTLLAGLLVLFRELRPAVSHS